MSIKPLHADLCWHDGRGPMLRHVHYDDSGVALRAIDYANPDDTVCHLVFSSPQVSMFTPEEVENYGTAPADWIATGKAAIVDLGRSMWFSSFAPHHLGSCSHFRIMFYDQFLDVICEGIRAVAGPYAKGTEG